MVTVSVMDRSFSYVISATVNSVIFSKKGGVDRLTSSYKLLSYSVYHRFCYWFHGWFTDTHGL